ncbi:hypothetical protein IPH25_01445 [bacterium]|nr:MAG: hypothetical protein IPH25_01445 [bacterium]QQR63351.1 MAG: hypothetical protein IPH67_02675 [bacterium]
MENMADLLFKLISMFSIFGFIFFTFIEYFLPALKSEFVSVETEQERLQKVLQRLATKETDLKQKISQEVETLTLLKQKVSFWNSCAKEAHQSSLSEQNERTEKLLLQKESFLKQCALDTAYKTLQLAAIEKAKIDLKLFFQDPEHGKTYLNSLVQKIATKE